MRSTSGRRSNGIGVSWARVRPLNERARSTTSSSPSGEKPAEGDHARRRRKDHAIEGQGGAGDGRGAGVRVWHGQGVRSRRGAGGLPGRQGRGRRGGRQTVWRLG